MSSCWLEVFGPSPNGGHTGGRSAGKFLNGNCERGCISYRGLIWICEYKYVGVCREWKMSRS